MIRLGVWAPVPHVVRAEPPLEEAVAAATRPGVGQPDIGLDFAVQTIQLAERLGFDVTLVAERLLGPDHESWLLATALARATERMEIMVAAHPGLVPPQFAAKMGATLDRMSRGRFSMNVVNGWWQAEMDMFGNGAWLEDPVARYERMDEYVQVLRLMWGKDAPRFSGMYYRLPGLDTRLRPTRMPPLYAASRAEAGRETTAKYCDWWFAEIAPDRHQYEQNFAVMERDLADMRARAERHKRWLRFGVSAHVICAPTQAQAEAEAAELEEYGKRDRIALIAAKGMGAGLIGTPDLVAARIDRYAEAGVGLVMLRFHPMQAGMEYFMGEVAPLLHCWRQPAVE